MREEDSRAHGKTHDSLRANRLYLRDIYARHLFEDERDRNPHTKFERAATWLELTKDDRDEYRKLANNLVLENS